MKLLNAHLQQEKDQYYGKKIRDPYQLNKTYPDPTICNSCGSLYTNGKWTWHDLPEEAHRGICPACHRIRDNHPGGIIELRGSFLAENKSDILDVVHHIKDREIIENPMERVLHIYKNADKTIVTTTGIHLARAIGDAIAKAFKGDLAYNYDDINLVRVRWERD